MYGEALVYPGSEIVYPDSDGQPMADNTLQFEWIVVIKKNLDALFSDDPLVFVAGDLLWYPLQGRPDVRRAPDTMVVFGRPKGERGSYQQWNEAGIAPQVVFEVLSPGNTRVEMRDKWAFYNEHGVEEYYVYDPDHNRLEGWLRRGQDLERVAGMGGWVSPRLRIRFAPGAQELQLYRPNGKPFLHFEEVEHQRDIAELERDQAHQQREREQRKREQAELLLEQERQRAERMEAKLREMGIDPQSLLNG